jgi:hypothetical protein
MGGGGAQFFLGVRSHPAPDVTGTFGPSTNYFPVNPPGSMGQYLRSYCKTRFSVILNGVNDLNSLKMRNFSLCSE